MEFDERAALLCASAAVLALTSLAGCPTRPHGLQPAPAAEVAASPAESSSAAPGSELPRHEGRPYDVESRESLLTILAFRGGALAKAGHNHIIASHDVGGTFYVPDDALHSTFELHVPVAQLTIDEPELRAREGLEFAAEVPESAREGTRRNMLGEALLNEAQYPEITLVGRRINDAAAAASIRADVQVTMRGQAHSVSVPVAYALTKGELVASGELPLRQSDLGLTPFSAMLGALQVQDELRIRFRIVARQAQTRGAGP